VTSITTRAVTRSGNIAAHRLGIAHRTCPRLPTWHVVSYFPTPFEGGSMSPTGQIESGIEQLLRAETELHPPKFLVEQARLRDYAAEYKRSVEDPEMFWDAVARTGMVPAVEESL